MRVLTSSAQFSARAVICVSRRTNRREQRWKIAGGIRHLPTPVNHFATVIQTLPTASFGFRPMDWGFVQLSAGNRGCAQLAEPLLYDLMSRPKLPRDIRSLLFEVTVSMIAIDDRVSTRELCNRLSDRFGQRVCLLSWAM